MPRFYFPYLLFLLCGMLQAQVEYPLSEDSKTQPNVPKGEVLGPFSMQSEVFPGTERDFWIYVPQQYNPSTPAALMVTLDGYNMAVRNWKIPTVLDNLIQKKEVPITIGVFVEKGIQKSLVPQTYDRPTRSIEYDSRGPETAKMIIEEILPQVFSKYNIHPDPSYHLIAGNSSGGNAAFNVAWERPDYFSKVFTGIGSFTSLREGHDFITLIRKTERKPLRIYLQDGANDLNNFSGDWWMANQYMLSSLTWAGYEVNHTWGEDTHSYRQGAAIMPSVLRWLWKDHPKPIDKSNLNETEKAILLPGENWKRIAEPLDEKAWLATMNNGEIFILSADGTLYKLGYAESLERVNQYERVLKGMATSPENTLCSCDPARNQIVKIHPGPPEVLAENIRCDELFFTKKGIYYLNSKAGNFGFYSFKEKTHVAHQGIKDPTGLSLSAEQTFLNITDPTETQAYSIAVDREGKPSGQPLPFFHYHRPYFANSPGSKAIAVDRENQTYTATAMGIQVSDQLGRVILILPLPQGAKPYELCFGGKNGDLLYVASDQGIFSRKMANSGVNSFRDPVRPTKPIHVKPLKE